MFIWLFKEYGLPKRICTDNGVPFATNTLARLSMLSAWWVRLGILPELIEPGKPQQNGRHERMHKTLKAEATKPPAGNLQAQQRKFNRSDRGITCRKRARHGRELFFCCKAFTGFAVATPNNKTATELIASAAPHTISCLPR